MNKDGRVKWYYWSSTFGQWRYHYEGEECSYPSDVVCPLKHMKNIGRDEIISASGTYNSIPLNLEQIYGTRRTSKKKSR